MDPCAILTCNSPDQSCLSPSYQLDAQVWPPAGDSLSLTPLSAGQYQHRHTPHRGAHVSDRQTRITEERETIKLQDAYSMSRKTTLWCQIVQFVCLELTFLASS